MIHKLSIELAYDILGEINNAGDKGTYIRALSDKLNQPEVIFGFYISGLKENGLITDIGLKQMPQTDPRKIRFNRYFKITDEGKEILQNRLT